MALVIKEGRSIAEKSKTILGRTAVQKLLYFLQVLMCPMGYRFGIHHYGPFCDEISSDIDTLSFGRSNRDLSGDPRYSNYSTGEQINELLAMHLDFIDSVRTQIRTVASALAPMKPSELELLATLHYAFRVEQGRGGEGPWKPRVVSKFREFKGDKFNGIGD